MALTRATIEAVLIRRCGRLLRAAQLDGTTIDGTNADLNDPIGWAIRQCGATVASLVGVVDADVVGVSDDDLDKLLDLAELRTLESISGNLSDVSVASAGDELALNDLARRVEVAISRKRTQAQRDYGLALGGLSVGAISLGFQEQNLAE